MLMLRYQRHPKYLLVILCPESCIRLETHSIDADEPGCISRIVVKGIATSFLVHTCQVGIVQGLGAGASHDVAVALVQDQIHVSRNVSLTVRDRMLDEIHFGCKPKSVIA